MNNEQLIINNGCLDVKSIQNRWYDLYKDKNYGAFITFTGIVRDEGEIDGLSFDIHQPLLQQWFDTWNNKLKQKNAIVLMAHSLDDVLLHETSFICAVLSPQRKVALKYINEFVEDFKANAPIWKYDLKNGKRVYALERSSELESAGILK